MSEPEMDTAGKAVIALAQVEAQRLGHNYIGTGHILLAIAKIRPDLVKASPEDIEGKIKDLIGG